MKRPPAAPTLRHWPGSAVLLVGLLAACTRQADEPTASTNDINAATVVVDEPAQLNPPAPGEPGGLPDDRTPISEGPIDPKSAQGAGQVLQRYFAYVESGNSAEASKLWSEGARKLDLTPYREVHANIGAPGEPEGAAGSIYVDIPVQLYGRLLNGKEFNRRGTMTLRRVNDVPGSTAEQRAWHVYKGDFPDQPNSGVHRFVGRWAATVAGCSTRAWRFTAQSLNTPAGSQCTFRKVTEVPGGYDISARCTAEGPPVNDTLKLRFAESARALLFESESIADAGLVRCQ